MRVWLALLVLAPSLAHAQATSAVLRATDGSVSHQFRSVSSVRELSNGRVVVADGPSRLLFVADFATGDVAQIGQPGTGPGEYLGVSVVLSSGFDSSVIVDGARHTGVTLAGQRIVGALATSDLRARRGTILRGADDKGDAVAIVSANGGLSSGAAQPDSNYIVLIAPSGDAQDTLARALPTPNTDREPINPYVMSEQPGLSRDGWVAVLRIEPYRVDWRTPDGKWIRGGAIPYAPIRMSDEEKKYFMDAHSALAGKKILWPETVPPVVAGALPIMTSDGKAVIIRTRSSALMESRYDVINRRGDLDGQVVLPKDARIVGFGRQSVYVSVKTDGGDERLERHPWP